MKLALGELPATAKKHMSTALPKGKTLQDVFADFIRYLFDSTKEFIRESEPMGKELWEKIESNIDLILSHPNGWEGREQDFLRRSVVQASILTEEQALSRVSFVTEGEATFNYCVINTQSTESLEVSPSIFQSRSCILNPHFKAGHKVFVIDAGGGTIDISSYNVTSISPLKVEEFHEPKCEDLSCPPNILTDREIGFYQGGEIVTASVLAYGKGESMTASCPFPCLILLF